MKTFQLPDQKEFMHLLLKSAVFDNFLLSEASIHIAVYYAVDGHINPDFYSQDELQQNHLEGLAYLPYGRLRPVFYELIKGRSTPTSFKFVLMLSPENLENTIRASGTSIPPADIQAAFFNIIFQKEQLILTTGVSYRNFILDKSFESEWEKFTIFFLKKNSITFSII